jgi:hypothetical protein
MQELFKEITIREKQMKAIICNTEKLKYENTPSPGAGRVN